MLNFLPQVGRLGVLLSLMLEVYPFIPHEYMFFEIEKFDQREVDRFEASAPWPLKLQEQIALRNYLQNLFFFFMEQVKSSFVEQMRILRLIRMQPTPACLQDVPSSFFL